jgi:type III secretion protein C
MTAGSALDSSRRTGLPPGLRRYVAALLLATLPPALPARAAALPTDLPTVAITAREQPVGAFLRDLLGQLDQTVIVSDAVSGSVNGSFNAPADRTLRDILRAFALIAYNDGAAIYVYSAGETTTRSIPLGPGEAPRLIRMAQSLQLTDGQNRLRVASDGLVVATGTPRFVEQVAELARRGTGLAAAPAVRGADTGRQPAGRGLALEFRVFYLRYARAEDTVITTGGRELRLPGVASTLRALVLDTRDRVLLASTGGGYSNRALRQSANRVGGLGLGSIPAEDGGGTLGVLPAMAPTPQPEVVSYESISDSGDPARIEASASLNAVIVRDTRDRMPSYDRLIQALDVEPNLVEIEATIIDINTSKARELGINWRFASGGANILFGTGQGTPGREDFDSRLQPDFGQNRRDNALNITPTAPGLAISTIIGSGREFLSRIIALEQLGAARIVSRPQVMTLSNLEAIFDRTRTFYVRVAGPLQVDLFTVTAGTVLRVNPHVFREGADTRIRVILGIEDGSISRRETVDGIPIVDRASVATQALILAGQSVLVGGMTVDSELEAETRVPVLGSIPIIGNLFRTRNRSRERIERLFLITPRLVSVNQIGVPAQMLAPAMPVPALPRSERAKPAAPAGARAKGARAGGGRLGEAVR